MKLASGTNRYPVTEIKETHSPFIMGTIRVNLQILFSTLSNNEIVPQHSIIELILITAGFQVTSHEKDGEK